MTEGEKTPAVKTAEERAADTLAELKSELEKFGDAADADARALVARVLGLANRLKLEVEQHLEHNPPETGAK